MRRMIYVDPLIFDFALGKMIQGYDIQVEFKSGGIKAKAQMFDTVVEGMRWAAKELNLPYRLGSEYPYSMSIEIGEPNEP